MKHLHPIRDVEIDAIREELATARKVEAVLNEQLAAERETVRSLTREIARLRSLPTHCRDIPTEALQKKPNANESRQGHA
jgi:hypothetical protein